jgi:hypothetical protein
MKSRIAQYLNEIVSITIMMLMVMALIAGQMTSADAAAADEARRVDYSIVLHIPAD